MITLHQAILYGERILNECGVDQPRWNAERLLLLSVKQPRSKIYADLNRSLTGQEEIQYKNLLSRRCAHFPLAYLEGTQEFFGREFVVAEGVLIPRPETEEIIRAVLGLSLGQNSRILDLGSGSGNLPVTLSFEMPDAFIVALEKSTVALPVLLSNSKQARVFVVRADFSNLCFQPDSFDVITANLPYVEADEFEQLPAETKWEPREALLTSCLEETYERVMRESFAALKSGGYLIMEIGYGQGDRIAAVAASLKTFKKTGQRTDVRGILRVLIFQKVM